MQMVIALHERLDQGVHGPPLFLCLLTCSPPVHSGGGPSCCSVSAPEASNIRIQMICQTAAILVSLFLHSLTDHGRHDDS